MLDLTTSLEKVAYHSIRQNSGNYVQGGGDLKKQQCFKTVSKKVGVTPEITDYLNSNEWKARSAGDKILHEAVMQALENTIDNVIGRERFEERLDKFKELQGLLSVCEKDCEVCSPEGEFRDDTSIGVACTACNDRVLTTWRKERSD